MENKVDLGKYREWEGKPGELAIPEAYINDLRYEIVVFVRKERGGSDFTFRCKDYKRTRDGQWLFRMVMVDSSKLNPEGKVELARYSYHPEVFLVNIAFMVYPKPADAETSTHSSP